MCGIMGYVGERQSIPNVIKGLYKMEYRGYDSAGLAFCDRQTRVVGGVDGAIEGRIKLIKKEGKITSLEEKVKEEEKANKLEFGGGCGIGHTRWATHGEVTDANSHPHMDCEDNFAVVHNGIIDNYVRLKEVLEGKGHIFRSETDSEVIVHLIEDYYGGDFEGAVIKALEEIEGTYGLIVMSSRHPDVLICARNGSPVVIGRGEAESVVASDVSALLSYTSDVIYLEDGEIATLKTKTFSIRDMENQKVERVASKISLKLESLSKGEYPTYMLKEIYEQGQSIGNAIKGRLNVVGGDAVLSTFINQSAMVRELERIIIIGMGTSYHCGLLGKYYIEEMAGIPVDVEYASEFRYRGPILNKNTLVIAISQSGETADTLGGLREAKLKGALVYSICNVVGSTIARESDGGIFLHAGPEIGVASTKAFTSQLVVLLLISLSLGRRKHLSLSEGQDMVEAISGLPELVQQVLDRSDCLSKISNNFLDYKSMLYLGRGYNYAVALEGALKLKEISYIHAEGLNASELKHGSLALIDENMPVIVIALKDYLYEKTLTTIAEIKSRKGIVVAIATEGDKKICKLADYVCHIPPVPFYITPILSVIPLQLLAYHIATKKDCNVDQPRNLAKSVTVE